MQAKKVQKLLKKVQNDYSLIAEDFSNSRKKYEWKEFEDFKKYIQENQIIIDIGCGNGRLRNSLPQNIQYIGIDNSKNLLGKGQKLHPLEKFIEGDILDIPISDKTSDVTFCIAALHHIPSLEFRKKTIKELKRITKNNGYIIITVWNLWQKKYWKSILKAIFHTYEWNDLFIPWANKVDRYYHAFTQSEFRKLLESEFEIVEFFKSSHNFCAVCRKK